MRALALVLAALLALPLGALAEDAASYGAIRAEGSVAEAAAESEAAASELAEAGDAEGAQGPSPSESAEEPPTVIEDVGEAEVPPEQAPTEAAEPGEGAAEESGAEAGAGDEAAPEEAQPRAEEPEYPEIAFEFAQNRFKIGKGEKYIPELIAKGISDEITFVSQKPGVFAVDPATGEVEGKNAGEGKLVAQAGSLSASATIQVCAEPKSFALSSEKLVLGVGEEASLEAASFVKKQAYGHVTEWSSEDAGVAAVERGAVKAVAKGSTRVTATLYNGLTADCDVTVLDAPSEANMSIALPAGCEDGVMGLGEVLQAEVRYEGAAGACRFDTGDERVISVNEAGRIQAVGKGEASIIALAYNGAAVQRKITVTEGPSKLAFANAPASLCTGEQWKLEVRRSDEAGDACGGKVTFKSSKPGVLAVDPDTGMLTAKKKGSAKITATGYNKVKVSATIAVKLAPESLKLDRESVALGAGEELALKATLLPAKSGAGVRWSSSAPEIVAVENGKLKAGALPGSAVITASTFNAADPESPLTASCRVEVKEEPSGENAALEAEESQIGIGQTTQLRVVSETAAGSVRQYASSAKKIAKVSNDGVVKGLKKGSATISAILYNGVTLSTQIDVFGAPSRITLSETAKTLYEGESFTLEATLGEPGELCIGTVTFKSSKPKIASVDKDGRITANAPGKAKITATTQNKKTAKCTITVKSNGAGMELSSSALQLRVGEGATLSPVFRNAAGLSGRDVSWRSSNANVASVADGQVMAVGKGTAKIIASASDPINGNRMYKAECKVTVKAAAGLTLDKSKLALKIGESALLWPSATGLKKPGDVQWSSSDDGVATVKSGCVLAVAPGEAVIEASITNGGSKGKTYTASCSVSVEAVAEGFWLSRTALSLERGASALLSATIIGRPDLNPKDVIWESSDAGVASVDGGNVTAVGDGSATITARVNDPQGPLTAQCSVTVTSTPVELHLNWERLLLTPGNGTVLKATLSSAPDVLLGDVYWSTSNARAVAVDNGKITAVAEGSATITASAENPNAADETLTASCEVRVVNDWAAAPKVKYASATSDGRVQIEWESAGSESYSVYEEANGGEVLCATVNNTSALLCGVTGGVHTYIIRPRLRINADWQVGEPSERIQVQVDNWRTPANMLLAKEADPGCVSLRWESLPGAESYVIYEVSADETLIRRVGETARTFAELSDVSGGWHSYAVRAVVDGNEGNISKPLNVRVNSLEMEQESIQMLPGDKRQIYVIYHMDISEDRTLSWSSSNEEIVSVDSWGRATAQAAGEATITAQTPDGSSASCKVQVVGTTQQIGDFIIKNGVVVEYLGEDEDVVVPDIAIGIGAGAFAEKRKMKSIWIPDSVTSIKKNAFYLCDRLEQVRLPSNLKSIGDYAFCACGMIENVVLPDSLEKIGAYAFSNAGIGPDLVIPDSVTSIGDEAFRDCLNLKSAVVPGSLKKMGFGIFFRCLKLEKAEIKEGATSVGRNMFEYCTNLKDVSLPESLTKIDVGAFDICENYSDVRIPKNVKTIGYRAFCGCAMQSVTIPDGVKLIDGWVFASCENLTDVEIPDSVKSIGQEAFMGCESLKGITIPDSVKTIGESAFRFCDNLLSISLPESVTSIGKTAFEFCPLLSEVSLPQKLSRIGEEAFGGCESLAEILIPDSVTEIHDDAFYEDTLLLCASGSYAESWARKNKHAYQTIGMARGSNITLGAGMYTDMRDVLGSKKASGGYKSHDPEIARFTSGSVLYGVKAGQVQVQDKKGFHKCNVTVVGFQNPVIKLPIGESVRQAPIGISGDNWTSSDPRVASVDSDGMVTANLSSGSATITLTVSDELRASYTVQACREAEVIYTEPGFLFLDLTDGATIHLPSSMGGASGTATFTSSDSGIASVDSDGFVYGKKYGRARITASSPDNPGTQAICDVVVLNGGYDYALSLMENITDAYDGLLRVHASFDGGYYAEGNKWVEPVDITKITHNWVYDAYDFMGAKSGTLAEDIAGFANITYTVEKILNARSADYSTFGIGRDTLKEVFTAMGLSNSMLNSFLKFMEADDWLPVDSADFKNAQEFSEWFKAQEKSGALKNMEKVSKAGKGLKGALVFAESLNKIGRFLSVKQADVQPEINKLLRSDDEMLQSAGMLLRYITSSTFNTVVYVTATMGFSYLEKELIKFCGEMIKAKLESIPVVGWFFIGADVGKAVGYAASNALTNADQIMSAAFNLEKASKAAAGYKSTFREAYMEFMRNPASPENYGQFHAAAATFSTLVKNEYSEFEEFVRNTKEALINEVKGLFSNVDEKQEKFIKTIKDIGLYAGNSMLDTVEYFNEQCDSAG